jgi:hypothetical protein
MSRKKGAEDHVLCRYSISCEEDVLRLLREAEQELADVQKVATGRRWCSPECSVRGAPTWSV